jgi:2-furoate---CoA ligase
LLDLGRTFLQAVERCPRYLAIVDDQHRHTYEEWALFVGALEQYLLEQGLKKGDRVLSILQNRFEAATLHWACQMVGITIVPINWRAKSDEIEFYLNNSQSKFIFYESASGAELAAVLKDQLIPSVFCGPGEKVIKASVLFSNCVEQGQMPIPYASVTDCSVMLYTSGTTGKPKGVPRTQAAERAAGIAHISQNQYKNYEVTLGVMPLYHTMGVRTLLALCLGNGAYIALPKWHAPTAVELIAQEKVSHLYLVPTLYHDLINTSNFSSEKVKTTTKLGFAGAPMHDALLLQLNQLFQPELFVNHYGSSEIYTFTINQQAVEKPGSAGRAGLNERIRVVALDDGAQKATGDDMLPPEIEGQIICDLHSDEAFSGYWERPDADEKSLRGGWYFTGDTGYFDQAGELFVTGRVDDMIISGGENISPVEIESLLSLHPAVDEVAVAGMKDDRLGQKVVAFIHLKEDVLPEELDLYCKDSELLNFKRPREYVFVKEIPKSPVGKILRRKLVAGEYELS